MAIEPKKLKSSWAEYLLPALGVASLLLACIILSPKKYFWNDELYSYYFLSDPSFFKMLAAFHDKINNTPILYFLLGWIWDKLFGSSELSYRLFSSLGMGIALVVTWFTIRRTYAFWPTTISTLAVFCTSQIILDQNAEARMYGLFLAVGALAFLLYDTCTRHARPSGKILWLNAAVHIALVHTHLFGGFYSGAILVAFLLLDILNKRFRLRVYLSVVLSWLTIIFYIPSFLVQADAGNPTSWIPVPLVQDLINFLILVAYPSPTLVPIWVLSVLVLLTGLLFLLRHLFAAAAPAPKLHPATQPDTDSEVALLLFGFALIAVPVLVWFISRIWRPIFFERYLIVSALAWVIFISYFSGRMLAGFEIIQTPTDRQANVNRLLAWCCNLVLGLFIFFLLAFPVMDARSFIKKDLYLSMVDTRGYTDLPIVVQMSRYFVEQIHYASDRDKYFFILDQQAAFSKHSGIFSSQEFKHLQALKRQYPERFKNVLTSAEFLQRYDRFLVIDKIDYDLPCPPQPKGLLATHTFQEIHCPQWVEMRLLHNATYQVTQLNTNGRFSLLLAEKQGK